MNENSKHIRPLTYRQNQTVEIWIKDGRKSKANALRKVGYGKSVISQPHKVFDSPAVQQELELRGYGFRGIGNHEPPKAVMLEEYTDSSPVIDFSKITNEKILWLKEQLAELPDVPDLFPRKTEESFSHSYTPNSKGVDILSEEAKYHMSKFNGNKSYSCM